ncbi:branched-chain amino acid ABC transporter permease [Neoaquamicrobium sediminum]|uniref:branched-chain amino acid ABC transporter permease n=1 Tax=Neoaquamicrobium sediminum TaxID=1849104 RepID=UPI0035E454DD
MEYFVQQLINGLTLGSIYGLIAIGYTMVYGIIGMINFAHGDIFMIGSFIALATFLVLTTVLGFAFLPVVLLIVLIVSMLFTSAWGWTVERLAYRPLRGSFRLAPRSQRSACRSFFRISSRSHRARASSRCRPRFRAASR